MRFSDAQGWCRGAVAGCLLRDSQKVSPSQGYSCCTPRTPRPGEQGPGPAKAESAGGWPTRCCTIRPCRPSGRGPCRGPRSTEPSPEGGEAWCPCLCWGASPPPSPLPPSSPSSLPASAASLRRGQLRGRFPDQQQPPAPEARGRCGGVEVGPPPLRRTLVCPLGLGKPARALEEVLCGLGPWSGHQWSWGGHLQAPPHAGWATGSRNLLSGVGESGQSSLTPSSAPPQPWIHHQGPRRGAPSLPQLPPLLSARGFLRGSPGGSHGLLPGRRVRAPARPHAKLATLESLVFWQLACL